MKQKDAPLIIISVFLAAILSFVASNLIFGSSSERKENVEIAKPITSEFNSPKNDDKYFNGNSIDPTQLIRIGDGSNDQPFRKDQ
ncbi:hypothetical protein KA068_00080 [Candidatus Saccharibacteria bacterium]|nr:hypothetical protein [Candidatus Saccharibacteria bacterium]